MRTISPSKFSASGGCCKFLNLLCDKKGGNLPKNSRKKDSRQNQDSRILADKPIWVPLATATRAIEAF